MKATLSKDATTGRQWLEFPGKPAPEVIAALKADGWRWSGYRKAWHNQRKYVKPPAGVEYEDGGEVNYAEERADRLEERADKAAGQASAKMGAFKSIHDNIPFGQPILVGHHSERRHRRDLERARNAANAACELSDKADGLRTAAEASRAHQAHLQSAPVIARRLERLRAELRSRERSWSTAIEENPANAARWAEIKAGYAADIAKAEADLEAAGGIKTVADWGLKPGDIVDVRGFIVKVEKVNRKTIHGTITTGGAKGMGGKWDFTKIRKVIQRVGQAAPPPAGLEHPSIEHAREDGPAATAQARAEGLREGMQDFDDDESKV